MSEQYMMARINELLSQIEDLNYELREQQELVRWWEKRYYDLVDACIPSEDRLYEVAEGERQRK